MTPEIEDFTKKVVDHLIKQVKPKPLQIILFGSQARGDAGPNSDIDLMLVFPDFSEDDDGLAEWRSVRRALREVSSWRDPAVDTIIASPARIDLYGYEPGWAIHSALQEGRVLYG